MKNRTRIIICGGRDFSDQVLFEQSLSKILCQYKDIELISGHAKGADTFAEQYAIQHKVPISVFKPDWKKYGRAAGPIRNKEMLDYALVNNPVVIAFWDGNSKGTANMINQAKKAGAECHVIYYRTM